MGTLLSIITIAAWVGLLTSLVQIYRVVEAVHLPGMLRILFLSTASLKLWVALVLAFFLSNTIFPGWAGDSDLIRLGIRFFFGVYLLVQTIAVNVAIRRWKL